MKIRILIKDNLDKIYNILPLIENNKYLAKNIKNIQYFNEDNWSTIFEKVLKEVGPNKEFERLCVFDEDGMLPFVFFTKQKDFVIAAPYDKIRSNLSRSHNNSNSIIVPCKYVKLPDANDILNTFFETKNEGGRHATRVSLMQSPFKETNFKYKFDLNKKDTILICSDHAGYNLKESIKKYLIEERNLKVIDVGCNSSNSTHYPLFAIALVLNANKACCGIGICSTGVGIANTFNKFKGINSYICSLPEQAKLIKEKYNANVLAMGANFIDLQLAKQIVDQFLSTQTKDNPTLKVLDNYGYDFDFDAFKKIEINPEIEIPKELKK